MFAPNLTIKWSGFNGGYYTQMQLMFTNRYVFNAMGFYNGFSSGFYWTTDTTDQFGYVYGFGFTVPTPQAGSITTGNDPDNDQPYTSRCVMVL